jgi:hypothetical protein
MPEVLNIVNDECSEVTHLSCEIVLQVSSQNNTLFLGSSAPFFFVCTLYFAQCRPPLFFLQL